MNSSSIINGSTLSILCTVCTMGKRISAWSIAILAALALTAIVFFRGMHQSSSVEELAATAKHSNADRSKRVSQVTRATKEESSSTSSTDPVRVAFIGNSIIYYDLPRFMEALSGNTVEQDSCLRPSGTLKSIVEKGNNMIERFHTEKALTSDGTYDIGAPMCRHFFSQMERKINGLTLLLTTERNILQEKKHEISASVHWLKTMHRCWKIREHNAHIFNDVGVRVLVKKESRVRKI